MGRLSHSVCPLSRRGPGFIDYPPPSSRSLTLQQKTHGSKEILKIEHSAGSSLLIFRELLQRVIIYAVLFFRGAVVKIPHKANWSGRIRASSKSSNKRLPLPLSPNIRFRNKKEKTPPTRAHPRYRIASAANFLIRRHVF